MIQGTVLPFRPNVRFAQGSAVPAPKPAVPEPVRTLLHQLPKTELHSHLSGSTPIGLIRTFLREQGWDEGQIQSQTQLQERYADLNDFLATYYKVASHVKTADQFRRATVAIIQEAARENVRYLEIRSSILSKGGETPAQLVDAIEAGMREGEAWVRHHLGQEMKTGLIVLAQRAGTPEQSLESAKLAVDFSRRPGSRVVGFDLAGSETNHPVTRHADALRYVKKHGLPLTVHAGETSFSSVMSGADSIKAALSLGADRIGHGIQASTDPALMARLRAAATPLEVCPDSNVRIGEVPSYAAHPLPKLLNEGLNVNLNSDNRMITPINLAGQLENLYREGVLTCWEQLKTVTLNGVRGAFLPLMEKRRLERQFRQELATLERRFQQVIQRFFCRQCDHNAPAQPARQA